MTITGRWIDCTGSGVFHAGFRKITIAAPDVPSIGSSSRHRNIFSPQ
jgi:hypothetical protein